MASQIKWFDCMLSSQYYIIILLNYFFSYPYQNDSDRYLSLISEKIVGHICSSSIECAENLECRESSSQCSESDFLDNVKCSTSKIFSLVRVRYSV